LPRAAAEKIAWRNGEALFAAAARAGSAQTAASRQ
jgi:hypothetical protein